MSYTQNYRLLLKVMVKYQERLKDYDDVSFNRKPAADVWSPAEVYAHIIAANSMTARGLMKIIDKSATLTDEPVPFLAKLLLWSGRFPKGRKVPAVVEARTPKIASIEEAQTAINACLENLQKLWDCRENWNLDYKIKHPALGMLNLHQWLRFMLVHSKHHWKQLDRVS
jgi:hypothetical protein